MSGIERMLEDSVPNGYYILAYSWMYVNFDDWAISNPNLLSTFQTLGATNMGNLDSIPFVFFVQKGNPSSAIELYGQNIDDSLFLTATLNCFPLGVSNVSNNSFPIQIIPNPSNGIFNCHFTSQINSIVVYNTKGAIVFEKNLNNIPDYSLDLSSQSEGVYFLKINSEKASGSKRIVVIH